MHSNPSPPTPVTRNIATAFAPASVANLAVGFDVLGFAVACVGDRVRARFDPNGTGVQIGVITGLVAALPLDPALNTASVAVLAMAREHPFEGGITLDIYKGIPLGSGMGGSAASAVAAVVAANALRSEPLPHAALLPYAVEGESVASGSPHADNVAPSLLGGMIAVVATEPLQVVPLPVPEGLEYVLVHPHLEIETRTAREALGSGLLLGTHVHQSQRLAGFLAACYTGDLQLLGRSMVDLIAEPKRAGLIPGYDRAKQVAEREGALGFAISGAGPSVFAWVPADGRAERVKGAIVQVFKDHDVGAEGWIGSISGDGARVERPDVSFMADHDL